MTRNNSTNNISQYKAFEITGILKIFLLSLWVHLLLKIASNSLNQISSCLEPHEEFEYVNNFSV